MTAAEVSAQLFIDEKTNYAADVPISGHPLCYY